MRCGGCCAGTEIAFVSGYRRVKAECPTETDRKISIAEPVPAPLTSSCLAMAGRVPSHGQMLADAGVERAMRDEGPIEN